MSYLKAAGNGPGTLEALGIVVTIACMELAATMLLPPDLRGLNSLIILRFLQLGLIVLWMKRRGFGAKAIGLAPDKLKKGLKVGLIGCVLLGVIAILLEVGTRLLMDDSFLGMMKVVSTTRWPLKLAFAMVIVGPFVEELVFRGVLYAALRRQMAAPPAIILNVLLFGLAHLPSQPLPLVQMAGALVFCIAHERSSSLVAPVVIHSVGNAAMLGLTFVSI